MELASANPSLLLNGICRMTTRDNPVASNRGDFPSTPPAQLIVRFELPGRCFGMPARRICRQITSPNMQHDQVGIRNSKGRVDHGSDQMPDV
jgi:hypothetical protein